MNTDKRAVDIDLDKLEGLARDNVRSITMDPTTLRRLVDLARVGMASGQAAPELYTCIDKGGEYALVGDAIGAGEMRGTLVTVYRDTTSLDLFYRSVGDFGKRMRRIVPSDNGEAA